MRWTGGLLVLLLLHAHVVESDNKIQSFLASNELARTITSLAINYVDSLRNTAIPTFPAIAKVLIQTANTIRDEGKAVYDRHQRDLQQLQQHQHDNAAHEWTLDNSKFITRDPWLAAMVQQGNATQSNTTTSITSVASNDFLWIVGSCRFRRLATSVPTFITTTSPNMKTERSCANACEGNGNCVGYSFVNNVCSTGTAFESALGLMSGVCVHRGGCSGVGDVDECVWADLPHTNLASTLPQSSDTQATTFSLCRSSCAITDACVGYTFDRATRQCTHFQNTTVALSSPTVTAFCYRSPIVESAKTCWAGLPCKPQPTVRVASATSPGPLARLTSPAAVDDYYVRLSAGAGLFTNVTLYGYGNAMINVTVDGYSCPVTSVIFVDDEDLHTLWAWDPLFPPYGGFSQVPKFLVVRMANNCSQILLVVFIAGIVAISTLTSFFSMNKIFWLVMILIETVALWDTVNAFQKWQCDDQLKQMFLNTAQSQAQPLPK